MLCMSARICVQGDTNEWCACYPPTDAQTQVTAAETTAAQYFRIGP